MGSKIQLGNLFAALLWVLSLIVLRPLFEEFASSALSGESHLVV